MNLKDFEKNFFSKRKKEKENFVLGINKTYLTMVFFIVGLTIYYVWTLNVNATKGYSIRQLEIEKNDLLLEKSNLENKIADLESLPSIKKNEGMENMEEANEPKYIVIKEGVQYVYNN